MRCMNWNFLVIRVMRQEAGGKGDLYTFSLKKNAFYATIRLNTIGVLRDFSGCGKSLCGVFLGVLRSQLSWAAFFGDSKGLLVGCESSIWCM